MKHEINQLPRFCPRCGSEGLILTEESVFCEHGEFVEQDGQHEHEGSASYFKCPSCQYGFVDFQI